MVILNMMVGNLPVNIMVVIGMVVLHAFKVREKSTMNGGKSLVQRHRETELKVKRLKKMGFIVIQKWSCEFQREMEANDEMSTFVKSLNVQDPIS